MKAHYRYNTHSPTYILPLTSLELIEILFKLAGEEPFSCSISVANSDERILTMIKKLTAVGKAHRSQNGGMYHVGYRPKNG